MGARMNKEDNLYKKFSVLDSLLSKLSSPLKGFTIKDRILFCFLVFVSCIHSIAVRIGFLRKVHYSLFF